MSNDMKRPDEAIETARVAYGDWTAVAEVVAWLDHVEAKLAEARLGLAAERAVNERVEKQRTTWIAVDEDEIRRMVVSEARRLGLLKDGGE